MINIKRQNRGKARTRFGILLRTLLPRYQRVLFKNPVISKNSSDDRFLLCVFKMEDSVIKVSHLQRPFVNPETREVSTYAHVKRSYKIIDWTCAYCKNPIKSKVDNFKIDNFTCTKCYTYYVKDVNNVSQSVLDSMLEFTEHYKQLIKENQKKFLKYIRKNEKKNSLL
jgi:copper chaperone CopZ